MKTDPPRLIHVEPQAVAIRLVSRFRDAKRSAFTGVPPLLQQYRITARPTNSPAAWTVEVPPDLSTSTWPVEQLREQVRNLPLEIAAVVVILRHVRRS